MSSMVGDTVRGVELYSVSTDEVVIKDTGIGSYDGKVNAHFNVATGVKQCSEGRLICFLRLAADIPLLEFDITVRAQYVNAGSMTDNVAELTRFYSLVALPVLYTQLVNIARIASTFSFNLAETIPDFTAILQLVKENGISIQPVSEA